MLKLLIHHPPWRPLHRIDQRITLQCKRPLHSLRPEIVRPQRTDQVHLEEVSEAMDNIHKGRFGEADDLLKRASAFLNGKVPQDDPALIDIFDARYHVLLAQGKTTEARSLAFKQLEYIENSSKSDVTTSTLRKIIHCYNELAEYQEAQGICGNLVENSMKLPQGRSRDLTSAAALIEMGNILRHQDATSKQAEKCFGQAIKKLTGSAETASQQNDVDHLRARAINGMGMHYLSVGQPVAAENFFITCLLDLEKSMAPSFTTEKERAKIVSNLGEVFTSRKEWDKAKEYYERTLKILEGREQKEGEKKEEPTYGRPSSSKDFLIAETLRLLANVHQNNNRSMVAEGLYRTCIVMLQKIPHLHREGKKTLKNTYEGYSNLLNVMGRKKEAHEMREKMEGVKI
ncbi:hypothetical protein PROFUN_06834 [Planoprotostelium fungivorum]|uniref:Uncharacterized protein n=1 Tax=Planoprotostelium fungivorum TaxID=1890364 RepID=A0A2P6NND2_9EUKA|nr:hypothetical protein PROFUN_06834 [Planoprotostelium fungivorum]